ncbi:hypothetical protein JI721_07920 [Alicyclobacillus cycloheptanicus]|uniref:DUF5067 domain-containing protein n=1 Tax=Alicyclobacillus cycloheptanicus TaxID=1457 RepID=A0ABT9XJI1_9BACL|nr:hypothetical protein [Alicyclobacillus cycloheptanicus]MDQ0190438.1 hypothetical protein [Alicyclobacillus cycloheptanicus]WDM02677.1 hypothetical protein JI721_07920 [Alicyclobacillus cycloheptanicus]
MSSRGSQSGWRWGCIGLALVGLLVWWTHQPSSAGKEAARTKAAFEHTVPTRLHVAYTGKSWRGQPLYVLENESTQALQNLQIFNWNNDPLPLLWVGSRPPNEYEQANSTVQPPLTLAPGQQVWFEMSERPPQKLTVMWLGDQHAIYETVNVH